MSSGSYFPPAGQQWCSPDQTAKGPRWVGLSANVTAMITLHGDAMDPINFPGGVWPKSNSSQYRDVTVTDGDADWSLKQSG